MRVSTEDYSLKFLEIQHLAQAVVAAGHAIEGDPEHAEGIMALGEVIAEKAEALLEAIYPPKDGAEE